MLSSMLKKAGVLALVLAGGALQPAVASAQDRFNGGHDRRVEARRDAAYSTREYQTRDRGRDWNQNQFVREDRDETRSFRRQAVVTPASEYYRQPSYNHASRGL